MRQLAFTLVMAAPALSFAAPSFTPVEDLPDGTVRAGDQVWSSREEFNNSDFFRENGLRCGTVPRVVPTDALYAFAPTDCGLDKTVINNDYIDNRTLIIPVVFHVISTTDGTKGVISDALLKSQVDILNEDYAAMAGTNGAMGNNAGIQFVLAKYDPQGNPTTGIDRVTNNTYFSDPGPSGTNQMKRALKWDPTKYFNIYTNSAGSSSTLGYATFPAEEAGGPEDGVVLNWKFVGRNPPGASPYDLGRTATHEVGHYLGLYHTFQGGCGSTSQPFTTGDLIADTTPEADSNGGCTPVPSGCGGNTMSPIENYMDYSPDRCMTKFTVQQVNRIRCSMMNYRWINTAPTANFTFTSNGLETTFTNTSTDPETTNAAQLHYKWTFGDGAMDTTQNPPKHTYAAEGTYTVTLEVVDPGSGTNVKTQMVTVSAATTPPDNGSGSGSGGTGSNGGNGEDPGSGSTDDMAGCCDTRGGGNASIVFGLMTLGVVVRRRRR